MYDVIGISPLASVYVSLVLYGILASFIGALVLRAIRGLTMTNNKIPLAWLLTPSVAFCAMSFQYSERSINWGGLSWLGVVLALLTLYLVFNKGFKQRAHAVAMFLLVLGAAFGSTDAVLLLVPFFLLLCIFSRAKTSLAYALVPLAYFFYAGYYYMVLLKAYTRFAWQGFFEFLARAIAAETPERVIPWARTIVASKQDAFISSVAYLSLLLACVLVASLLTYNLLTRRKSRNKTRPQSYDTDETPRLAGLIFLWIALAFGTLVYIGISTMPEVSFSDTRTIAIVFPTWILPFLFIDKHLVSRISRRRILVLLVVVLMVFASLRASYQIYPKSIQDSINVVEDTRLGSTAVYSVAHFANSFYQTGSIVADYKTSNRVGGLLAPANYDVRPLSQGALVTPSDRFPERSIVVFNIAGIKYPSIVHTSETYLAAYNFSVTENRIYDNGAVIVSSQK
jgi:phosphate/sulfate permease